jgi:hypothetical protein
MMRSLRATTLVLLGPALPGFVGAQTDSGPLVEFLRGDANLDGRFDVSDPILTLRNLFLDGAAFGCPDAADSDDSGAIDIADPIRGLSFLFLGSRAPAPPFPAAGVDPTADSLPCLAPAAIGDIEPERPLSPGEVAAELRAATAESSAIEIGEGAIEVSSELFDLLSGLEPGATFDGLLDFPGLRGFIAAAMERAPPRGAPIAIPFHLRAPMGPDGCREIDAASLRGLSRDLGPDATPDDALTFDVEPRVVCGAGAHAVRFTVTDADGLSSEALAMVELCDGAGEPCLEAISVPESAASGPPRERLNCVWVATRKKIPAGSTSFVRGTHYDAAGQIMKIDETRPILVGDDPLEIVAASTGAGPTHKLILTRSLPTCTTPPTNLAIHGWGRATIRLNLICFASDDCTVAAPPPCEARTAVEGSYEAGARVSTAARAPCDGPLNFVEALVQEEAKLEVNGNPLFNKALAIQTGTTVHKRVSLEVSGNLGASRRGVAAEVGVAHGLSHEVWSRTGRRAAVLRAFSSSSHGVPVTADLTAQGKAELVAHGAADGMAHAATEAYAVYAVGTANCPGAGAVFLLLREGRGEALARVNSDIQDFYRQHLGRELVWEPDPEN